MAGEEGKVIKIYVDMRETVSGNIEKLRAIPNVEIAVGELPSGDYVVHETTCIERKTAADFVASILDNRLFTQIAKMKNEYTSPVVLIEGDVFKVRSAIKREALIGAMSYCTAVEKVNLITVADGTYVPMIIATMARHLQHGLSKEPTFRPAKPKPGVHMAQYLVEGLPGVGPKRARELLAAFRSPLACFNATPEQIGNTKGVGVSSGQRMFDALRYEVPEDFDPSKPLDPLSP